MTTWNKKQLEGFATQAGFNGQQAYIITAIALAESGGNDQAKNCNNPGGTCDRGVVQINNYYHKEVSDSCAYDPLCAFQAAYKISGKGQDFSPWTTFQNGAYKKYLSVQEAQSSLLSIGDAKLAPAAAPGFQFPDLGQLAEKIALFLLGIIFIIIGYVGLTGPDIASHLPVVKHFV